MWISEHFGITIVHIKRTSGVYFGSCSSVLRLRLCGKLAEDDLKQIKICRSFSGLCVKVYNLILVHVFVLLIKKSYCV